MLNCMLSEKFSGCIDYEQLYEKSYLVSVLETVFKFTKDIYILADVNFKVKYTNCKYISHNTDIPKLLRINPKNLNSRSGEIKKTISFGEKTIKADVTIAKIFTNSKNPDGYILIIRDMTKDKLANVCLDRVMNFLQHELKTSVLAQSLGIKLLKTVKNNEEILDELENSTENIFRMLKNVIYEVDINENPIILNKQKINIKHLFEQIKQDSKNFLKSKSNTLLIKYKNNFDFIADEQLLMQVITTVLFHSNEGCRGVNSTICLNGEKHKSKVIIKISGYFNAPKRSYFNELKEAKNTLDRFGFDNGLYLSAKIAEAHNGRITVSTKNFISTVSIILPV